MLTNVFVSEQTLETKTVYILPVFVGRFHCAVPLTEPEAAAYGGPVEPAVCTEGTAFPHGPAWF